jgi:hypothetical protein
VQPSLPNRARGHTCLNWPTGQFLSIMMMTMRTQAASTTTTSLRTALIRNRRRRPGFSPPLVRPHVPPLGCLICYYNPSMKQRTSSPHRAPTPLRRRSAPVPPLRHVNTPSKTATSYSRPIPMPLCIAFLLKQGRPQAAVPSIAGSEGRHLLPSPPSSYWCQPPIANLGARHRRLVVDPSSSLLPELRAIHPNHSTTPPQVSPPRRRVPP